jgi:hypothetical protein
MKIKNNEEEMTHDMKNLRKKNCKTKRKASPAE